LPVRLFISFAVTSFLLCLIQCFFFRAIFLPFRLSTFACSFAYFFLYLISFAVAFLISLESICSIKTDHSCFLLCPSMFIHLIRSYTIYAEDRASLDLTFLEWWLWIVRDIKNQGPIRIITVL
jgi:hypothetical protein